MPNTKLPSPEVIQILMVMTEMYERAPSKDGARILALDLAEYPQGVVLNALQRCRKEMPRFPTLADIISRIDDGRPGIEEAWAMIPKTEDETVVWTEEMRDAYSVTRSMMSDPIAARMTFREKYGKLLAEARSSAKPTKWEACLGTDPQQRAGALAEAVRLNRIDRSHARALIPDLAGTQKQLAGPEDVPDPDAIRKIRELMANVLPLTSPSMQSLQKIRDAEHDNRERLKKQAQSLDQESS